MTLVVQLNCVHCRAGIDIAEPFWKLNTGPLRCSKCEGLNTLCIEDEHYEDGPIFYLEAVS